MFYIIENKIIFNPEDNTLSLQDNIENQVSISNPARRILLLLIEQQGAVVQRDMFFKKVWDDYGLVSSNNNLNHCISKLRKVINTLGHTDEVIVTVPKVGFLLKKEIAITLIDDLHDILAPQPDLHTASVDTPKELLSPPKNISEISDVSPVMAKPEEIIVLVETPVPHRHNTSKKDYNLLIIGASFLILLIAMAVLAHEKLYDPKARLQIGFIGQCGLYSTTLIPSSQHAEFIQRAQKAININNLTCEPGNIFIFQSEALFSLIKSGATRDFLAECKMDSKTTPTACLSIYVNNRKTNDNL